MRTWSNTPPRLPPGGSAAEHLDLLPAGGVARAVLDPHGQVLRGPLQAELALEGGDEESLVAASHLDGLDARGVVGGLQPQVSFPRRPFAGARTVGVDSVGAVSSRMMSSWKVCDGSTQAPPKRTETVFGSRSGPDESSSHR